MEYAAHLQNLAEHCAFGGTLSETLRDRFVCGMRDERVQKRLLTKTDLTLAKALETAEIAERAAKDAEQLQSVTKQEQEVHQVAAPLRKGRQSGPGACYRCGGAHDTQQCRFRNEVCRFCRKREHIEKACRAKKNAEGTGVGKGLLTKEHSVNELEGDSESEEGDRLQWGSLHGLAEDKRKGMKQWKTGEPMYVEVMVNEQPLRMELDTRVEVSILPFEEYKKRFKTIPLQKTRSRLKTYMGVAVRPRGQIKVTVRKDTVSEQLIFVVVDGSGPHLFGRNWLASLPVEWSAIKSMTMVPREGETASAEGRETEGIVGKVP